MALAGKPFLKVWSVLKQIAPTVLAAAGGPAGMVAASVLKNALGDPAMPDSKLEDAVAAATGSADGLAKLKQAELDIKKIEADTGVRFAELDVADRASARDLAVKTSALPQIALSTLFVVGYFTILVMFFYHPTGVPMSEAFTIMLGVLTAGMSQVLNYFLGSSSGSAAKTETIAAAISKSAP